MRVLIVRHHDEIEFKLRTGHARRISGKEKVGSPASASSAVWLASASSSTDCFSAPSSCASFGEVDIGSVWRTILAVGDGGRGYCSCWYGTGSRKRKGRRGKVERAGFNEPFAAVFSKCIRVHLSQTKFFYYYPSTNLPVSTLFYP